MRRATRRIKEVPQEPVINITPLIDVVFVILIAFILVAPLLEFDGIKLAGGASHHNPIHMQDMSALQIHVYADNTIMLNSERIELTLLPQVLHKIYLKNPSIRPQLFHDKKAHFGTYQTIKNSLEIAGFKELDIVLMPN